uniref:C2 DOCK-type domain-containing protein n=1 Tax=Mesocestoides corti TaxID=53468 RepID=A0A5K3FAW8_MESCO
MANLPGDLIKFLDLKNTHTHNDSVDILQEFDPLFCSQNTSASSSEPTCESSFIDYNHHPLVDSEPLSRFSLLGRCSGSRSGGVFDKDLIWDELEEVDLSVNSSNTFKIMESNPSSDCEATDSVSQDLPHPGSCEPQQASPSVDSAENSSESPLLPYITAVDIGLSNFAKAVHNCVPLLPPTEDNFPLSSSPYLNQLPVVGPPVALNGYLIDGLVGSPLSYCLSLDTPETLADDWRLNPGLMPIADRSPQVAFVPLPGVKNLPDVFVKIYIALRVYFYQRYSDSVRHWTHERMQSTCAPSKLVSSLIAECLKRAYRGPEKVPRVSDYCLRIYGRTDILHPNARLCDHEYIQTCCRTGTTARLVLEAFSDQEYFLPTMSDSTTALNLHETYAADTRIVTKDSIELSVERISRHIHELGTQISYLSSPEGLKAASNTCEFLRQTIKNHVLNVCHGVSIGSLAEAMTGVQQCLYNLMLRGKPKGRLVFRRSLSSPKEASLEDEEKLLLDKLAVLEVQVVRQTVAFLKWKQAWYPDLQLSLRRPAPLIGSVMECERLLGCQITPRHEAHRMSKCDLPLIVRIGGVIVPTHAQDPTRPTDPRTLGGCVRIHVALTYAGRPLSKVCTPDSGPSFPRNSKDFLGFACTTPVLRDFHYSRKADLSSDGKINEWIRFVDFTFRRLPRETLLSISLISLKKQTEEPAVLHSGTLLGWVNVPIFDANGRLRQEVVLAGLWPPPPDGLSPEHRSTFTEPNRSPLAYVVELEFPIYESDFFFPKPPVANEFNSPLSSPPKLGSKSLLEASSALLNPVAYLSPSTRRLPDPYNDFKFTTFLGPVGDVDRQQEAVEELWQIRGHLTSSPELFSALLVAAPVCWPQQCRRTPRSPEKATHEHTLWMALLSNLYSLIQLSAPLCPAAALRLLLPDVPDQCIRHWAVCCLSQLSPDGLISYLPSILEAVNYDLHMDWSGLVSLLLHRSATSLRFCNALYWNIEGIVLNQRYHSQHRLILLKTAITWLRGSRLKATWSLQARVVGLIRQTAEAVKSAKTEVKLKTLQEGREVIQGFLDSQFQSNNDEGPSSRPLPTLPTASTTSTQTSKSEHTLDVFRLPYDFGFGSRSLKVDDCTYITSFTCPIRLTFSGIDGETRHSIFKVGDDLQMDLLICQLIQLADRIWLDGGLDLCVPHFKVMPTEPKRGFIEPVSESETLRIINRYYASNPRVKKDCGLLQWLRSNHKTPEEQQKAISNFARSTVAGSVLTFVLGLGDRHNDNIMMRKNGQSFHIDFAKVFGNFQKVLNFNRDRSPFILTPDMLEVVKAAEPSSMTSLDLDSLPKELISIPNFVRQCCQAYNMLRSRAFSIMGLMEMAWQMRLPGLERGQIGHVSGNLRRNISDLEAEAFFRELIQRSIQSYSSQLNNMIHDRFQRTKKQPIAVGNLENKYSSFVVHGVYLNLSAEEALSSSSQDERMARISISEASVVRNGRFLKPVFKFQVIPNGKTASEGFCVTRDSQDLKILAWSLLAAYPNSHRALALLNKLAELDDCTLNCAQPSPPSDALVNDIKTALVDLIRFYPEVCFLWWCFTCVCVSPTSSQSRSTSRLNQSYHWNDQISRHAPCHKLCHWGDLVCEISLCMPLIASGGLFVCPLAPANHGPLRGVCVRVCVSANQPVH